MSCVDGNQIEACVLGNFHNALRENFNPGKKSSDVNIFVGSRAPLVCEITRDGVGVFNRHSAFAAWLTCLDPPVGRVISSLYVSKLNVTPVDSSAGGGRER